MHAVSLSCNARRAEGQENIVKKREREKIQLLALHLSDVFEHVAPKAGSVQYLEGAAKS